MPSLSIPAPAIAPGTEKKRDAGKQVVSYHVPICSVYNSSSMLPPAPILCNRYNFLNIHGKLFSLLSKKYSYLPLKCTKAGWLRRVLKKQEVANNLKWGYM